MSRAKSRQNLDVCGDCGAQGESPLVIKLSKQLTLFNLSADPTWVSINRGILLCINCCSIHRSLGRHVSQVKSLQKSTWNKSQLDVSFTQYFIALSECMPLQMVYALNNSGVNNIWEHLLLENNSKSTRYKKPTPKDPLK